MKAGAALVLYFIFMVAVPARAESDCSGATYGNDPLCGGGCVQAACIDVSSQQDGSLYQCCPPSAPELPAGLSPFTLALVALGAAYWIRSRRRAATAGLR